MESPRRIVFIYICKNNKPSLVVKGELTFSEQNSICVTNWERRVNASSRLVCYPCSFSADIDNSGYVSDFELQELFREASLSLPGYKVREIAERFIAGDTNKDEKISFEEFVAVRAIDLLPPIFTKY